MTLLPPEHPLTRHCRRVLASAGTAPPPAAFLAARLPGSRPVFRFSSPDGTPLLVGKFFAAVPPETARDRALTAEWQHYREACRGGAPGGRLPRVWEPAPELKLGLLLEYVPGPTLDDFLACARDSAAAAAALQDRLARLAHLLAWFHTRPAPQDAVSLVPAFQYLEKLGGQLRDSGLLEPAGLHRLAAVPAAWGRITGTSPDRQVLLHGDATPTNFLFPDGGAVAVDLERLRLGDRLFDVGWVAGELRHAFAWRFRDPGGAAPLITAFLSAYREAVAADAALGERLARLTPLYLALALLRIARNGYLAWEYRRFLVEEGLMLLSSPRS
ncbi:MAG: phosphotransferase [Syntrophobacterales bacterium]|nr:phosphotransferase [Syntrophobacterales bacterium]